MIIEALREDAPDRVGPAAGERGEADLIAMARELMYNPNWPVHAAKALDVPDYLKLLPPAYAWWLERRESIRDLTARRQASLTEAAHVSRARQARRS